MKILIIDGQGGNIGKALVEQCRRIYPQSDIIAVGTNSMATANMIHSNPSGSATGENPVVVNARDADFILGPIGIILADSMLGEITPAMARAVGESKAHKILIPMNKCVTVAGVEPMGLSEYISKAVKSIEGFI
ncbi:MAG: DUF3842 family protein [Sphaerochaetaceae bacterium]|nr:DUF3842 family protein [Sphaerochaetaceae bacterium]